MLFQVQLLGCPSLFVTHTLYEFPSTFVHKLVKRHQRSLSAFMFPVRSFSKAGQRLPARERVVKEGQLMQLVQIDP